jgi:hypothetical protein
MTGKWTVYCRDTFDGTTWDEKFDTREDAVAYAVRLGGTMLRTHVEGPDGVRTESHGTY